MMFSNSKERMPDMKLRQIAAGALCAVLAFSLTACDADPVGAARERMEAVESMDASVELDMAFRLTQAGEPGELEIAERLRMDITSFSTPLHLRAEIEVSVSAYGASDETSPSSAMTMYAEEDGQGSHTMYLTDGTGWKSQPVAIEDLGQYNAAENMHLYLNSGERFALTATETLPAGEAVRYDGVIRGEALQEVLRVSGALDSLDALSISGGADADRTGVLFQDLPDLACALWIDADSGYPVRYEMDMTALMNQIMSRMAESMGPQAGEPGVEVERMALTMTCSNFNSAAAFEIPGEARQG